MKRLLKGENNPPTAIPSCEWSHTAGRVDREQENEFAAAQEDKIWKLSAVEAQVANSFKDRD